MRIDKILGVIFFLMLIGLAHAYPQGFIDDWNETQTKWQITHYCSCKKCCGKWADGHFASGKKVYDGGVACNWLPFGTKVKIDGRIYTVEDRGAKSLFGTKKNRIKHIDIWMEDHQEALNSGVKYQRVEVMK